MFLVGLTVLLCSEMFAPPTLMMSTSGKKIGRTLHTTVHVKGTSSILLGDRSVEAAGGRAFPIVFCFSAMHNKAELRSMISHAAITSHKR